MICRDSEENVSDPQLIQDLVTLPDDKMKRRLLNQKCSLLCV